MLDGKRVLIVEADPVAAVLLQAMLLKLGAAAVAREPQAGAWTALAAQRFDLVFLDLCLGDAEGEALLRRLREAAGPGLPDAAMPVVVIAGRHCIDARLRLLAAGADRFVMQPFDLRELEALAGAIFRAPSHAGGALQLDASQRICRYRGRLVVLTRAEFDILLCLARSYPQAVPGTGLAKEAADPAAGLTALQVHIHHLRQKLEEGAIETVQGLGYRLRAEPLADAGLPQALAA